MSHARKTTKPMKFIPNKRGLPHSFTGGRIADGIVAEADICPHRRGRIAAKLLVFRNRTTLHRFWKRISDTPLGRGCLGAVNALGHTRTKFGKGDAETTTLHGDPRYFCLIGLCLGHLSAEVICHEAVHAGYCYEKRVRRNLWGDVGDFDEERIAYPTGAIAAAIHCFLDKRGLYNRKR